MALSISIKPFSSLFNTASSILTPPSKHLDKVRIVIDTDDAMETLSASTPPPLELLLLTLTPLPLLLLAVVAPSPTPPLLLLLDLKSCSIGDDRADFFIFYNIMFDV